MSGFINGQRADRIALRALQLREGDPREEYLASACGTDAALRAEVDRILADSSSGELPVSAPVRDDIDVPERIGPYRIVEEIGSGGMGRVYRALQLHPVMREVAVKFMRGAITSMEQRARFMAERQTLARLSHPHIAQLYDAGATTEGHPYFIMEYVAGRPITALADDQELSIDERLDLFVKACEGVEHAHRKGILHRDIKPENVLVATLDGKRIPKVIDFGIAKAADDQAATENLESGVVALGTAAYMSPEALDAGDSDVDVRSDVYSLGVMLYELLVGRRPYERSGRPLPRFLADIISGGAPRPSVALGRMPDRQVERIAAQRGATAAGLRRTLASELDWIVMRAIEADCEDRYGSIRALAADIHRYRNDLPVQAHPETFGYQLRKFVGRHKALAAAGTLAIVGTVVGVSAMYWGLVTAREAEARAVTQARIAVAQQQTAEDATSFIVAFLLDLDPYRPGAARLDLDSSIGALLQQIGGRLQTDQLTAQPRLRARIMTTLASVYLQQASANPAVPLLRSARQVLASEAPDAEVEFVELDRVEGFLEEIRGNYEIAQGFYLASYQRALRVHGIDAPETTRARTDLAKILLTQDRTAAALPLLEEAVDSVARQSGTSNPDYTNALNSLAFAHYAMGSYGEAEVRFRESLEAGRTYRDSDDAPIAVGMNNLAMALVKQGKAVEARDVITDAITILSEALPEGHWRTANARTVLAHCLIELDDLDTAERLLTDSYPVVLEARGENSPYAREIRTRFVMLYERMERPEDAARFREREPLGNSP